jgi:hypothetical protein
LLNDQWFIEGKREEIKNFLKFNENETRPYQNLYDSGYYKGICTAMFIAALFTKAMETAKMPH